MGDPNAPELSIDFSLFCHSLASQTLFWLGAVPDPATGETTVDIARAKATIDTLEMLRVKTQGNLDGDEEKILASLLFDLRLRYVEKSRKPRE